MIKLLIVFIALFLLLFITFLLTRSHSANIASPKPSLNYIRDEADSNRDTVIVDCNFTLDEVISGIDIPENIKSNLIIINVRYIGFDSKIHQGQLVTSSHLATKIEDIFSELLAVKFPIEKVIPVSAYNWSDSLSMIDNNTSCFNYRLVPGCKRLSHHALGIAIDVNPRLNPYYQRYANTKHPYNAFYDPGIKGTLLKGSQAVEIFKQKGWKWGGDWYHEKDYQHFYKPY